MKTVIDKEEISAIVDNILRLRSDQYKHLNPEFDNDGVKAEEIARALIESRYAGKYVSALAKDFELNESATGTIFTDGICVGMEIMEALNGSKTS